VETGDLLLALIVAVSSALGAGVGGAVTGRIALKAEDKRQAAARTSEERREKRELESEQRRERREIEAERRHDQREVEREAQVRDRELKEAARLVDEELRDATALLAGAIYEARWWSGGRMLSSDVYTRYRRVLALYLDDSDWSDVSRAYQELNRLNWESEAGQPLGTPLERIDLQSVGIAVVEARKALAPAAAPPDRASLLQQSAEEVAEAVFPLPDDEREQFEEELRPLLEEDQGDESE